MEHPRTRAHPHGLAAVPWVLAGAVVLAQILWVLAAGDARLALTWITVAGFALASVTHAALTRGMAWAAAYLTISVGLGWAAEVAGRTTGFPFGTYDYTDALGPKVAGVPVLIPFAWAMMAYPCLLLARSMTRSAWWTPLIAAWTLAAWDLFLDPQMVGEGYWTFAYPTPALPGSPGIPLTNYAGWLLVAAVMMTALDRLPRRRSTWPPTDAAPFALLLWTYVGSVLANAAFFGRPWVALWGAAGMGITVLPWLVHLRRSRAVLHRPG